MQQYECQKISLADRRVSLILLGEERVKPLCDSCKTKDCGNPIESVPISVLGIIKNVKIFNSKNSPGIVVGCRGYTA
jgi:hypothetical protein